MLTRGCILCGLTALLFLSCVGAGREARLIEATMRNSAEALEQKDFDKFATFFAPEFTCSMPDGNVLSRRQFLAAVASEMSKAVEPLTITLKQVRLEINGDSAESEIDETTEFSVLDTQGAVHRLRYSQRMQAHLAKVEDRWLNQSIKCPRSPTMWLDGRVTDAERLRGMLGR